MEKIFYANVRGKKAGVAVLIFDKIDFKTKTTFRDKAGHYIMINGTIQQEDITLVNIYIPNIAASKYVNTQHILKDVKGELDRNIVTVGDFNTPLTSMDRSYRQKINRETGALNNTVDQTVLIDIFRTFHPKQQDIHTFQVHMECILGLITC